MSDGDNFSSIDVKSEQSTSDVALEPVELARVEVLQQLFQLYAHDFSEHVPLSLQESGRFAVSVGEQWWTREGHHPFFVRVQGRLAGFALVRRGSQVSDDHEVMDVAEFFVVRGERRKQVGHRAAIALFAQFPGRWEVRVRHSNAAALRFWSRILETDGASADVSSFSVNGVGWHLLRAD